MSLATDRTALSRAVAGVRGFVLDADGVILLRGEPLPGAAEAIARLAELRIPVRVVTNFSSAHRTTLAAGLTRPGFAPDPSKIITAASAAAAYTARRFTGRPLFVIANSDALREFEGQSVLSAEAAAAPGTEVAAVVIGDGGDALSYSNLDTAFRLIRGGAAFLAMHRNPWWLTKRGVTLDAGAFVAGLEHALGTKATILGKPSPVVFRLALAGLAAELGLPRLPAASVAMVGDDPVADIAAAQRVGLRAILVLSGKVSAEAAAALRPRRGRGPDAIAASLAAVVAALD
ncbi:MAG TPA: HAD-IIA family hydrolase [Candidatus Polarisedimenticolia bacterium]|nr:HAD-IIA family hydrolase [Candidatus Polarisedimenticolia bacterium]